MPHPQGNRNHQQRRVFRGRKGITDGNLPPKKTSRPKVKYQPEEQHPAAGHDSNNGRHPLMENNEEIKSESKNDDDDDDDDGLPQHQIIESKLSLEIKHLERRIQNVQLSLQTSQGLSNPKTWRTNCLRPVRNVVREWRSILSYYDDGDDDHKNNTNGGDNTNDDGADANDIIDENNTHEMDNGDGGNSQSQSIILHSTSQQVFGLIQMAMQSGPLVGSNPGYFKRCGGEVASMAFEFLGEIAEFGSGTVDENIVLGHEESSSSSDRGSNGKESDDEVCYGHGCSLAADLEVAPMEYHQAGEQIEHDSYGRELSADDSLSESGSSSSTSKNEDDVMDAVISIHAIRIDNVPPETTAPPPPTTTPSTSNATTHAQTIDNLRNTYLFTEKQSLRFAQWRRNAEKAAKTNKPPSESAKRLQNQKSKKQKQKELKMERKMKKNKKRGGK